MQSSLKSKPGKLIFCAALAALTLNLAVIAQAQTVTFIAGFNHTNGDGPSGSVTQATDGNFYGTTGSGGVYGHGNVFRMTPSGTITSIYDFARRRTVPTEPIPQLPQSLAATEIFTAWPLTGEAMTGMNRVGEPFTR